MQDANQLATTMDSLSFLAGGGEMGETIRGLDLSQTTLGHLQQWPQSLRSAISICLSSAFPIAIYWGDDLRLLYNDQWRPICGTSHPVVLGQPAEKVWPEIWHIIDPLFRHVMQTGLPIRSRDQLLPLCRHGFIEECYFDYTFSPVRGENGEVAGIFNAVLETTACVIGERRLRTLRSLASCLSSDSPTAKEMGEVAAAVLAENPYDLPFVSFYLLEPDGQSVLQTGSTGIRSHDSVMPIRIHLDSPDCLWPFREVIETGCAVEVHDLSAVLPQSAEGPWPEPPHAAMILPLVQGKRRTSAGFVVAGISSRLELNDDYRGFLDLMAGHMASAISTARAHEQERQRSEMLAELNQAKAVFLSNASHEFRTPLTLILGLVEELLNEERHSLPSADRSELEIISRNGMRLLRLVNSLLDFIGIEEGRSHAAFCPADLPAVTADLVSMFRSACERAGLTLIVDCPPLPEPVLIDREMWEKIVLNLMSNAFKFTLNGKIAVCVREVDGAAELEITDTGTGMPADKMSRLFERFHRFEEVRGRSFEGSGIGLALVRELVHQHGGTIHVASVWQMGTTFTVRVPFGSDHLPEHQRHNTSGHTNLSSAAETSSFVEEASRWLPEENFSSEESGRHVSSFSDEPVIVARLQPKQLASESGATVSRPLILVVDDNGDMREYIVRLLRQCYRTIAVSDGAAALVAARKFSPDLLLMDVTMPGLEGFELLKALRSDPKTKIIPVRLLSSHAGESFEHERFVAAADDYMTKPFNARELLARIRAQLQMAAVRREADENLRQSQQRLQMALSAARMVAWQFSPSTGEAAASENAMEVLGLPDGTIIDRVEQLSDLIQPDDVEARREMMGKALNENGAYISQYRIIRPDNRALIWMEERGHATQENSSEERIVSVQMDITDRKRMEEERRAARSRLESALAASEIGTWEYDVIGNVVHADRNLRHLIGVTSSEGVSSNSLQVFLQAIHPEDRERVVGLIQRAICDGETIQCEYRLLRGEEIRWIVVRGRVERNTSGQVMSLPGVALDITGQRNAEERERLLLAQAVEANAKFRAVFEQGALFAVLIQVDGTIVEANRLCSEGCGFRRGQIIGTRFWEGPWWASIDSIVEDIRNATIEAAAGITVRREVSYFTDDGTERVADLFILPIRDREGNILFLAPTGFDITEQKRAERELRERADEIRILLDTLPVGVFLAHDPECRKISGNRAAQKLLRTDGVNLSKTAVPEEQPQHFRVFRNGVELEGDELPVQRAARRGYIQNEEEEDVFDDGTILHTLISASPLYDSQGRSRRAVASVLDVTERRRAENALQESQRFLRESLDALQSQIAVVDESGVILELNAAWRQFTGEHYLAGNRFQIGSNYLTAVENGTWEGHEGRTIAAGIRNVIEGRMERFKSEYSNHTDSGRRWFLLQATRFPGTGPVRVVIAHDNITDLKRAEQALRKVDDRKNIFLATVAHELRNPLAPIRNGLQLMRMANHEGSVVEDCRIMIERQLGQLVRLVDDLLDLSRIRQGKLRLQKEMGPLTTAISKAVETSRPLLEEMEHDLTVVESDRSLLIKGDLTRLSQVVTNLLNNAAKYTDRGGKIRLTVHCEMNTVLITVVDNGIGIACEQIPELFTMFSQVGNVLDKSQGGLGIGLSLVRQIVELHGGSVEGRSPGLGKGSEFQVKLPIVAASTDAKRASGPVHHEGDKGVNKLSLRILIVDDNRDGADSLGMMLRLTGNEIKTAYDGQQGLDVAEEFRPDVVLLDIGLPKVSGYEACRRLREQPWTHDVVFIAVTGWGQEDDRRRSHEAGFDHHLVKPVDSQILMKILAAQVEKVTPQTEVWYRDFRTC